MRAAAAPARPTTPGTRRIPLAAVIVVGALLVAGTLAVLVWRAWTTPPSGAVRDIDAVPELSWQYPLIAGETMTTISEDAALIFTPTVGPEPSVLPLHLIDLESGSPVWHTTVGQHAEEVEAYWLRPYNLPGTDFVVVKLFHSPSEPRTRHLFLDRDSGELHHVLDTLSDTSLLATPSGSAYLVDHVAGELSQLAPTSINLSDDQFGVDHGCPGRGRDSSGLGR